MGRTACTEPQCLYKAALYLYLYHILHVSKMRVNAIVIGLLMVYSSRNI